MILRLAPEKDSPKPFPKPTFICLPELLVTITTELELSDKNMQKRDLIFRATGTNQNREVVLRGKTYMKVLKN